MADFDVKFCPHCGEDELGTCVVDAVKKLMDHEREFEEIGGEESS